MNKIKLHYCTKVNAMRDNDKEWIDLWNLPEHAYENDIRKLVDSWKLDNIRRWDYEYYTFSSLVIDIFRLLIVEDVISKDDIEFYVDDNKLDVNEYGATSNQIDYNNHWLDVHNNIVEILLRKAIQKKKAKRFEEDKAKQNCMICHTHGCPGRVEKEWEVDPVCDNFTNC